MSDAVLELEHVTKVYGEEPPVFALRGVSFSIARGELVAIVGPSGSGKSTLLHVVGTLERPSSGVLRIGGIDAAGLSDRELSRLRAREIVYGSGLPEDLSAQILTGYRELQTEYGDDVSLAVRSG